MSKEEQYQKLCEINRVEGFDPAAFAVEYTDMNTGEVRKRLPVMIQMAWFRLKYPDGPECYLAEATASRGSDPDHPSVSPREWAQTAAVGVALRNAGFGLQFGAVGEDYSQSSPEELTTETPTSKPEEPAYKAEEPSSEEQLRQAMNTPCPIAKYKGKTLGDVLTLDPRAISWVANKFTGNSQISEAAKLLCDYALEQTAS